MLNNYEENSSVKNGGLQVDNVNAASYELEKKKLFTTKQIVVIGMFAALSYVLMLVHFPVKYLGFLEMEFSDIPAIVATLAYGPLTGIVIELIKNLIKVITASTTVGSGELANFVVSIGYILPLGLVYHKMNGKRKKLFACLAGTVCMALTGIFVNYYITVPLYASFFGGQQAVIGVCAKFIPAINSLGTVVILGITPFNIIKGLLISVISVLCYKVLGKAIK